MKKLLGFYSICRSTDRHEKNNKIRACIIFYTILFILTFLLSYSSFWIDKKSFIWKSDGHNQHYPALIYWSHYLRQIARNILQGNFSIPLFDINLAMGSDILTTLSVFYSSSEPLNLLSVIIPTKHIEFFYNFLIIFRMYLAGLAFCFLCFYHEKRNYYILIGALIYVYSGYTIYTAVRHPQFINTMIQLPLLGVGIDKIIKKERPFIFIFSVFYTALCGFYFLYMMTILLGLYAIIRFFDFFSTNRIWEFLKMVKRIASSYLLGIGLASITFLPSIICYFSSSRAGKSIHRNYFFYGWDYYRTNLLKLIAPPGSWDSLSFAAIALFALILLFSIPKTKRNLKIMFSVIFLIYLIPLGGYIMGGFGYPTQRWTFGFTLLLSYTVVEMMPNLLNLNKKQQILCFIILIIYAFCIFINSKNRTSYNLVGISMLAITLIVLLLFKGEMKDSKLHLKNLHLIILFILIISNVSINALFKFSKNHANYIKEFPNYNVETNNYFNKTDSFSFLKKFDGRCESSSFSVNLGSALHIPTTFTFWSMINAGIVDLWAQTECIGQEAVSFWIAGTDQRSIFSTLLSTKYFIQPEDKISSVPFGYKLINKTKDNYYLYKNNFALPWGYTYDSYTTYDDLDQMNGLQLEEMMSHNIILENDIIAEFPEINKSVFQSEIFPLSYKIVDSSYMTWENGVLSINKENASITLEIEVPKNVEYYLRLQQLNIDESNYSQFSVTINNDKLKKQIKLASPKYNWYTGRENYLINLGYNEQKCTKTCKITFPKKGIFKLSNIQLFALRMDNYPTLMKRLQSEPLDDVKFETNRITGTIDLSKDKILCMSIPYSPGWSATVDGKPATILKGNIMFMALALPKGHHKIEFSYCTPGLKAGIAFSILSFVIIIILYKYDRKNHIYENHNN